MNRNYYCKVNSQKEADELLDRLKKTGEFVTNLYYTLEPDWIYIGMKKDEGRWAIISRSYFVDNAIKVPASELIDYVTGKKVDKDALLEEAKRRYPIGTKFKIVHSPENIRKVTSHKKHSSTFVMASDGLHINLISELIEGEESNCISASVYFNGKWAEIVEEPKVETKFEVGKWYKINNCWYAKLKTIHGSGKYWQHSEVIDKNGKHRFDIGNLENIWKDVSIALLEDLSEIQQYLPAGHPDKIKEEFVLPEKWFIKSTESTASVIYDWLRVHKQNEIFYTNLNYLDKTSYVCFPAYNNEHQKKGDNSYTEITFDQFKKYVLKEDVKEESGLRTEDLIEGEIYCSQMIDTPQWESLHLYHGNGENMFKYRLYISSSYKGNNKFDKTDWGKCTSNQYRLATPLEKKWLNTCIKQDKFIPKEDLDKYDDLENLMKGKKCPEYIKCIEPGQGYTTHNKAKEYGCINYDYNTSLTKGRVYKVLKCVEINPQTWGFVLQFADRHYLLGESGAVPSNKEAYEAQFNNSEGFKVGDWVVVLPEDACYSNCEQGEAQQIVEIRDLSSEGLPYLLRFKDGHTNSYTMIRKAHPHEIPVENSVKQNPLIFEECGRFPTAVIEYIIGADPIKTRGREILYTFNTASVYKTTLSIDEEELPMVRPSKEIKITNKLTID